MATMLEYSRILQCSNCVTLEEELKDVLMRLERKSVCQASLEIELRNVVKVREEQDTFTGPPGCLQNDLKMG